MVLESDIIINAQKFSPDAIPKSTSNGLSLIDFLANTLDTLSHIPIFGESVKKWYQIDSKDLSDFRTKKRIAEQKSIPSSIPLPDQAPGLNNIQILSGDGSARTIPCRLRWSSNRVAPNKCSGAVLHIHGGGFVLGDELSQDKLLQMYADRGDLVAISVGYRLAPEHPFPAGPDDCFAVGKWLVENAQKLYGGPLRFIGGESGGAHLSMLTTIRLLRDNPTLKLDGIIQHFGSYSMTKLPQMLNWNKNIILSSTDVDEIIAAFLPGKTLEERQNPSISPFNENLDDLRGRLPSAIFTCGTVDPLLDDTIFMGTKWLAAGAEAFIKVYPGAIHGFIAFNEGIRVPGISPLPLQAALDVLVDTSAFIGQRMDANFQEYSKKL